MIKRPLWISAFFFLLLLAATWTLLKHKAPPPEDAFFSLKRRTPDTLTVAYGTDTTVLVPGGKGWLVIEPVQYPADSFVIEAMLKQLQPLEIETVYDLPREKLDSYGLRHPRGFIRASYRELPPDSLILGGSTPNATFDYVRPGGVRQAALVSSRTSRGYFQKSTRDLRDTRLLPTSESRVIRILLLDRGRDRVELGKGAKGEWMLLQPYPGRADPGKTREYLSSLVHMTVQEFVHEEGAGKGVYGLDLPVAGVVLETEAGEMLGYSIGNSIPGEDMFYAGSLDRPTVFGVSARYLPALQWPDGALRQSAPVTFGLAQVSSVTVRRGSESRQFQLSPPDSSVLPQTVDVLGSWLLLRATGFEPATRASIESRGLDFPDGELVWMRGPDTLAVVQVGIRAGGLIPMRVPRGLEARPEEILLVPEERARPLWVYLSRRLEE